MGVKQTQQYTPTEAFMLRAYHLLRRGGATFPTGEGWGVVAERSEVG